MVGQWHYLLYYGQDPAWSSVYYLTPFEDPRGHFQEPRKNIEICATVLDIKIQSREEEEQVRVGNAVISKSPYVQRKLHLLASRTPPKPPPKLSNTEPTPKVQARSQTIPSLVYRCYDEESQSFLDSKLGFRASLYGPRPRGVTSALSADDELFEVFAENVRSQIRLIVITADHFIALLAPQERLLTLSICNNFNFVPMHCSS